LSQKLPFGTDLPVVINIGKPLSKTVANSDAHVSPLQQEKAPRQKIKILIDTCTIKHKNQISPNIPMDSQDG